MTAEFDDITAALTDAERAEYAAVVACLLTGRCDGQQAVASIAALSNRFLASRAAQPAPATEDRAAHVVHVTAEPVAEDVVWCDDCEEWVASEAPNPAAPVSDDGASS